MMGRQRNQQCRNAYHRSDHRSKWSSPTQNWDHTEVSEVVVEHTPLSGSDCYMYRGDSWTATPHQAGIQGGEIL